MRHLLLYILLLLTTVVSAQVPDSGTVPTRPKLKQLERHPQFLQNFFPLTDTNGIMVWAPYTDSVGQEYHRFTDTRLNGFSIPAHGFIPVYLEDGGFWQTASTLNDTTLHFTYLVDRQDSILTFQQSGYLTVPGGHGLKTAYYYFLQDDGSIDTLPDPDRNAVTCVVVNDSVVQLIDNRPFKELDMSASNELQNLYLTDSTLCLTDGNCVSLDTLCSYLSCVVAAGKVSGGGFDSITESGQQIFFHDSTLTIAINKRVVLAESGNRRGIVLTSSLSGHAIVGLDLENIPEKTISALDRVVYYDQESDSNYTSPLPDISNTNEAQILGVGATSRVSTRIDLSQTATGAGGGTEFIYHVQDSFRISNDTLFHYIYQTLGDNMLVGTYVLPTGSGGGGGLDSCPIYWDTGSNIVVMNCGDTVALAFDYLNRDSITQKMAVSIQGDSAGLYYDGNLLGQRWSIRDSVGSGGGAGTMTEFYVVFPDGSRDTIREAGTLNLQNIAVDTQSYYRQDDFLQIFSLPQTQLAINPGNVGALAIQVPRQFQNLSWTIHVQIKHENLGSSQVGSYQIGFTEESESNLNYESWTGNYYDVIDADVPARTWHPSVVEVIGRTDTTDWLIKFGDVAWAHTVSGSFIVDNITVKTLDGTPIADSVVNQIGNITTLFSTQAGDDVAGTFTYQSQSTEVYKSETERVYWDNGLRLDASNNMYFIGGSFPHIDISRRADGDHARLRLYNNAILEFDGGASGALGALRLASAPGTDHWFNYGSSNPPAGEQLPFMFFGDNGTSNVAMFRGRGVSEAAIQFKDDSTTTPPVIKSTGNRLELVADTIDQTGIFTRKVTLQVRGASEVISVPPTGSAQVTNATGDFFTVQSNTVGAIVAGDSIIVPARLAGDCEILFYISFEGGSGDDISVNIEVNGSVVFDGRRGMSNNLYGSVGPAFDIRLNEGDVVKMTLSENAVSGDQTVYSAMLKIKKENP